MVDYFPIIEIAPDAPGEDEQMGTKEKFWFDHKDFGRCLYKKARRNTGEDWSEKIAAELSELLCLPHAKYELATFQGERGIISQYFLPKGGSLALGNEILSRIIPDYLRDTKSPFQHTIDSVLNAIASNANNSINLPVDWNPPQGISQAVETFVGYLLLDAWIGNTDRHHENWGFVNLDNKTYLAPTYDHASCLGRELLDNEREDRLKTKDSGFSVEAYANKSFSAFYAQVGDKRTLKTFDAFYQAARRYPNAASLWLDCLAKISPTSTLELFVRIPQERISASGIEFARKILEFNQNRLLELR